MKEEAVKNKSNEEVKREEEGEREQTTCNRKIRESRRAKYEALRVEEEL